MYSTPSSLCDTCQSVRVILTPKGSRFLLCQVSMDRPDYAKYPRQPKLRCEAYRPQSVPVDESE